MPSPRARPVGRGVDWLHGHVLIPGFEAVLKRRRTFAHWRALEQSQWLPPERILALQLERLRRLLTHAATTCPYYRDLWASMALEPAAVTDLAAFTRWPITDKSTRRLHRDGIRSQAPGLRMLTKGTSGSTGEPFAIDYDEGSLATPHGRGVSRLRVGRRASRGEAVLLLGRAAVRAPEARAPEGSLPPSTLPPASAQQPRLPGRRGRDGAAATTSGPGRR